MPLISIAVERAARPLDAVWLTRVLADIGDRSWRLQEHRQLGRESLHRGHADHSMARSIPGEDESGGQRHREGSGKRDWGETSHTLLTHAADGKDLRR